MNNQPHLWADTAFVRVCGLPVTSIPLSPEAIEKTYQELAAAEQHLTTLTQPLLDRLYHLIPATAENTARRHLLKLKRTVYANKPVSDQQVADTAASLNPETAEALATWREAHQHLTHLHARIETLCARHNEQLVAALTETLNNSDYMRSLALASPEFVQAALGSREKKQKKSERLKQQRTLYNYATRTAFKTSPFSWLTTVNIAGTQGQGRTAGTVAAHMASGLLAHTVEDDKNHPNLVVRPSPRGVIPAAGHRELLMVPNSVHNNGIIYREETITGAEWAAHDYPASFTPSTALTPRIRRHIASGALRLEVPWSRTGNPFSALATTFPEGIAEFDAPSIQKIGSTAAKIAQADATERAATLQELAGIARRIYPDGALGTKPGGLLYEDCESTDTIPDYLNMPHIQQDLDDISNIMRGWVYRSYTYDLMVRRFVARYGRAGVCTTPLSFCMSLAVDSDGDPELTRAQQQGYTATAEQARERSQLPASATACPRHMSALVQIVAAKPQDVDTPNHMCVINAVGNGAGAHLARVHRLFGEEFRHRAVERITALWNTHRVLELTFWAECNTGQAISSGVLPELQLPGEPVTPNGVPLENLILRHDPVTDSLNLCDAQGPVGLVYLGLTPQHMLNSYYQWVALLADPWSRFPPVGDAAATTEAKWKQFANGQVVHTPRQSAGRRLVTRRASWYTSVATLQQRGCLQEPGSMRAWYDLRQEHNIPRIAYVHQLTQGGGTTDDTRKPLFVDFTSPTSLATLSHWISSTTRAVRISEALPGPGQHPYRDADGNPRVSEIAVSLQWPRTEA